MISDNQSICPKCGGQLKYYDIMTDTVFTMKIGVEIVVLMYLGFLISTVGYDKVIQMLKQIQSVKEETKNE